VEGFDHGSCDGGVVCGFCDEGFLFDFAFFEFSFDVIFDEVKPHPASPFPPEADKLKGEETELYKGEGLEGHHVFNCFFYFFYRERSIAFVVVGDA